MALVVGHFSSALVQLFSPLLLHLDLVTIFPSYTSGMGVAAGIQPFGFFGNTPSTILLP